MIEFSQVKRKSNGQAAFRRCQLGMVGTRSSFTRSNRWRFQSCSSISKYVIFLLGLSILFFFSQTRISHVIVDNYNKSLISEDPQTSQELEEQLWDTSLGSGFRPCVKPTHKYEGYQKC